MYTEEELATIEMLRTLYATCKEHGDHLEAHKMLRGIKLILKSKKGVGALWQTEVVVKGPKDLNLPDSGDIVYSSSTVYQMAAEVLDEQ